MSYILEALKKAQAERQLGATPTIHAPTLHGVAEQPAGAGVRKPMLLALAVMGAVIVGLLALVWSKPQQTPPVAPAATPAQARSVPPAAAAQQAAALPPAATVPQQAGALPPAAVSAAALPQTTAPPRIAIVADPAPPAHAPATPAAAKAPDAAPARAAASIPPAAAAQDDVSQTMRDLPEPIQRAIPQVAVGGYIYSKNPADRLLLIDKVLRHEGEEVAPGLMLEKLLPKAAVFNFKGYRYRVPY